MIVFGQKRRKTARRNRFPLSAENQEKLRTMDDKNAPAPDIKKLKQSEDHYRLRVGDYRIIFTQFEGVPESCYVVAIKRRTSTTYLHEEQRFMAVQLIKDDEGNPSMW
jgi:mRNA-degrading endonuclease RelE of RelBE toxin-antitoxin system